MKSVKTAVESYAIYSYLSLNLPYSISVHDFCTDPLGWTSAEALTLNADILKHVQQKNTKQTAAIVIDSLSNLILHHSPAYTCQVINQFKQAHARNGVCFYFFHHVQKIVLFLF